MDIVFADTEGILTCELTAETKACPRSGNFKPNKFLVERKFVRT